MLRQNVLNEIPIYGAKKRLMESYESQTGKQHSVLELEIFHKGNEFLTQILIFYLRNPMS